MSSSIFFSAMLTCTILWLSHSPCLMLLPNAYIPGQGTALVAHLSPFLTLSQSPLNSFGAGSFLTVVTTCHCCGQRKLMNVEAGWAPRDQGDNERSTRSGKEEAMGAKTVCPPQRCSNDTKRREQTAPSSVLRQLQWEKVVKGMTRLGLLDRSFPRAKRHDGTRSDDMRVGRGAGRGRSIGRARPCRARLPIRYVSRALIMSMMSSGVWACLLGWVWGCSLEGEKWRQRLQKTWSVEWNVFSLLLDLFHLDFCFDVGCWKPAGVWNFDKCCRLCQWCESIFPVQKMDELIYHFHSSQRDGCICPLVCLYQV